MNFPAINPTTTNAWLKLSKHFETMKHKTMQQMFQQDPGRVSKFHIEWEKFLLDYSKNIIDQQTIDLLIELANETNLQKAIKAQFEGDPINQTENRAVLHTALRAKQTNFVVNGHNIMSDITKTKEKIKTFTQKIHSGIHKGFTGKMITDVVNIGVGGSDLGPAMVIDALKYYKSSLQVHFVSNIDGDHVSETLKKINPETTLFIVVSKSFTTQETLTNAMTIRKWFLQSGTEKDIQQHFIAVTSEIEKAIQFGISEEAIFPMWDWVGGRFSLWSAVGLSISLGIGYTHFESLLEGAQKMDHHFKETEFSQNIPVLLALLSVWYNNFFKAESEAIIPYSQYLQKLVPYFQQGIMESNGKNIDRNAQLIQYQTGTLIWGEPGTNCQHAFFQLLHQGTKLVPVDFIGFKKPLHDNKEHHYKLMANFFAQTEALLNGKDEQKVIQEFETEGVPKSYYTPLVPFKVFQGNKPTNTLLIEKLTPETLGSLIALYEHKIFVQGIIWNIYSYDQWGVELGKQLANKILDEFNTNTTYWHDASTKFLLSKFLEKA